MNDVNKLKEQYSEKYRGFNSYTECSSRALLTGLASFALTFSAVYFTQLLLQKRLPYQKKYFFILPVVASTHVSWTVTSKRTKNCQAAWMAAENKHTSLSNDLK